MKRYTDVKTIGILSETFSKQFNGKKCCTISFDLNFHSIPKIFHDDEAVKLAKKYRNNLSRLYFGRAARDRSQFANVNICLHKIPHMHFHIIAEIPDKVRFDAVRDFTVDFVIRNQPLCVPRKQDKKICFFEPRNDTKYSLFYNQRFGQDTCLIF